MADDTGQDKTEEPTPKRLKNSRDEGQVANSREITSVSILFAATATLYLVIKEWISGFELFLRTLFDNLNEPLNLITIRRIIDSAMHTIVWPLAVVLGAIALCSFISVIAQVGWNISAKSLEPKFEKLNPLSGFKRMFGLRGLVELAKGLVKLGVITLILKLLIEEELAELIGIARSNVSTTFSHVGGLLWTFTTRTLSAFAVMAVLDYLYQKYDLHEKLKMTKQEVKEEHKTREGDMQAKAKMRHMARQMLQKNSRTGLKDVVTADVVITNPSHYAVALKYTQGEMDAPMVVARGADVIAEKIKTEARRHGIPRVENRPLARALYNGARVGDTIPTDLYNAVAEVLAYVYRIRENRRH